jgi:hypothetical protein
MRQDERRSKRGSQGPLMARVYLHSGGIDATVVRTGTGGRKASQWRTDNKPKPSARSRPPRLCQQCAADKRAVREATAFLKEHKQPPLESTSPIIKGSPGSNLRRRAKAAQARIAACHCLTKRPTAPRKSKPAPTAGRGLSSTDPYKQVLANDRLKAQGKSQSKGRPATPRTSPNRASAAADGTSEPDMAVIREWAKQQGLPVSRRRLAAHVIQAYRDLH